MSTLLLYLLAFCSGFAALVYQVAWARMLSLTFGSSTLAVSAVVAGFMGGMGIGAWFYHRVGDRIGYAIRAYALLEVGIGVTTALLTLLFFPLPHAFAAVAAHIPAGLAMDIFRVATVFLLLLLPAALMGATYPALCQTLMHTARDVEGRLGWIYGLNTLGAATGALAAGFVMVEIYGSYGSVLIANAINLSVGLCAFLLSRTEPFTTLRGHSQQSDESLSSALPYWVTGVVLFGAGFATLGYEIVWFRALHYMLGSGTYVLSAALVIFLVGLGLGSFIYRPALRFGQPEWNLGFAEIAVAILAVLAIGSEQYLLTNPDLSKQFSAYSPTLMREPWQWRLTVGFGVAVAIMLPATICMGLTFPLASRLFLGSMQNLSSRVGLAYLLSNLGSILGAITAAFWILPRLGTVGGTLFLVGVNLLLALIVLIRMPGRVGRIVALAASAIPIVLALELPRRLAFQTYEEVRLQFEEESDLGTVQVYKKVRLHDATSMAIDGVAIAVTKGWDPDLFAKQLVLAHLPMLLDRNIHHTLNLGVASGATVKALSRYDWVETLDAVEINPAVIHAASYFLDSAVFSDPRANLYIEDAVHFLLRSKRKYDLIISDAKQQIRFGGNAKILSAEFYRHSLDALEECGLFVQFIPLLNPPSAIRMILRTFRSVFPEMEVFVKAPNSLMTVGSRCPVSGRERPTYEELKQTGVARDIEEVFLPDVEALPSLWVASGYEFDAALGDGPINTWDQLPLEFLSYRMPRPHPSLRHASLAMVLSPRTQNPERTQDFVKQDVYETVQEINQAYLQWLDYDFERAESTAGDVLRRNPDNPMAQRALMVVRLKFGEYKLHPDEIVW
jgi:spermidine synthase